ncbi:MAG: hypothetical protein ACHP9T_02015 [Caulobacterales bacterium]
MSRSGRREGGGVGPPAQAVAEHRLHAVERQRQEAKYACHEGDHSLPNILAGVRAEERAADAPK